jgi:hypothetical protein
MPASDVLAFGFDGTTVLMATSANPIGTRPVAGDVQAFAMFSTTAKV